MPTSAPLESYAKAQNLRFRAGGSLPAHGNLLTRGGRAENLVEGKLPGGVDGTLAHYTYTYETTDSDGHSETHTRRFTIGRRGVLAELREVARDAARRTVEVRRHPRRRQTAVQARPGSWSGPAAEAPSASTATAPSAPTGWAVVAGPAGPVAESELEAEPQGLTTKDLDTYLEQLAGGEPRPGTTLMGRKALYISAFRPINI